MTIQMDVEKAKQEAMQTAAGYCLGSRTFQQFNDAVDALILAVQQSAALSQPSRQLENDDGAGLAAVVNDTGPSTTETASGWSFEMRYGSYRVVNGETLRDCHESTYEGSLTEEEARARYQRATNAQIGSGTVPNSEASRVCGQERSEKIILSNQESGSPETIPTDDDQGNG